MHFSQLFVMAAGLSLISWTSGGGIVTREYLPAVDTQRFLHHHYPSYYQQQHQQHQQYYPSYGINGGYYPQYSNGLVGGLTSSLGLGPSLGSTLGLGSSLGLGGGYYNNHLNYGLVNPYRPKPRVDVIETVYDTNGGYIYGKKK
ncbi:uncharacterized protein LOC119609535 [Lucilia sericata]|uniref:uncharacterized protein LOC119609535 n=1 Tax=Lucilia sericata TaxID=13632 RepID=UPI0018A87FA6|nr:uncharacterized protein LOC119609535 [Lucilia sericata]